MNTMLNVDYNSKRFLFCCLFFLSMIFSIEKGNAEITDTLHLSMQEAEKTFLQNNFLLLANKYNMDANAALEEQAKLWDNPMLFTDQNVYDGGFFRHTTINGVRYGQVFIQVQQLIKTAGKRSKLAAIAADNTEMSRLQFADVMRSLRFTLQEDMLETVRLLKLISLYENQITEVRKLSEGVDAVYKAGNISLKEDLRIKALLFSLNNELVEVRSQLMDTQNEIRLILQLPSTQFIYPDVNYNLPDLIAQSLPTLDSLYNWSSERPDVAMARTGIQLQQHNLTYQKALAKPDLTIGSEYDRLSSYVPNYVGISASIPLPIFNRNQGMIKNAGALIKQQEVLKDYEENKVKNEIDGAYAKVLYYRQVNDTDQLEFSKSYDAMLSSMYSSYQERQIGLIDFTDFLASYKDTKIKLLEQHMLLAKAMLNLNFSCYHNIYSF